MSWPLRHGVGANPPGNRKSAPPYLGGYDFKFLRVSNPPCLVSQTLPRTRPGHAVYRSGRRGWRRWRWLRLVLRRSDNDRNRVAQFHHVIDQHFHVVRAGSLELDLAEDG